MEDYPKVADIEPRVKALPTGEQEGSDEVEGQSFLAHMAELRSRLIKGLLSIVPGFILAYYLAGPIISFLVSPLKKIMPQGQGLIATGLPDTFLIHLKLGLWGGLFVSSPFWLFQIWSFVSPGLYQREKSDAIKLSFSASLLMLGGAAFAYYVVFPLGFMFFLSFNADDISLLPTINQYLSLVMSIMLAFGLTFQLPLLILFLATLGLVDAPKLRKFRRYSILIIVILAAFMTPPDVISQILMSLPLIALYELSIFLVERRQKLKL